MSKICLNERTSAEIAAVTAFRELFGPPIDLWLTNHQGWQQLVGPAVEDHSEGKHFSPDELPLDLITEPVVQEWGNGLLLIGMPLESYLRGKDDIPDRQQVAWGTVRTDAASLAKALLRISNLKNSADTTTAEVQLGLEPHLEQICQDFEELTWLRELHEHLFECHVDDSLSVVASRILPDLRQLICAESLVLVISDETVKSESSAQPVINVTHWCGPQLLEDAACQRLVAYMKSRPEAHRAAIVNHLDRIDSAAGFVGIESCLMIPISHRGLVYGSLLAFNRDACHARFPALEKSLFADAVQDEFGTADASLLFSAASTLATHARNAELYREKETLLIGIIKAMINALDAKDAYTCGHSDRVASSAKRIGQQMGLPPRECELLYMSGLLHDIGKIGIPDYVLLKPGKLTPEEFAIIAEHPGIGHAILSHLPQLESVLPGVIYHHEHFNGRGYPKGLKEDEIPLFGRILAVADAYDAMTTCRPYRTAMPVEKARAILQEGAGTQWDPVVVEAFLSILSNPSSQPDHDHESLRSMFESVAAAGLASLSNRSEVTQRVVSRWNGGLPALASASP